MAFRLTPGSITITLGLLGKPNGTQSIFQLVANINTGDLAMVSVVTVDSRSVVSAVLSKYLKTTTVLKTTVPLRISGWFSVFRIFQVPIWLMVRPNRGFLWNKSGTMSPWVIISDGVDNVCLKESGMRRKSETKSGTGVRKSS